MTKTYLNEMEKKAMSLIHRYNKDIIDADLDRVSLDFVIRFSHLFEENEIHIISKNEIPKVDPFIETEFFNLYLSGNVLYFDNEKITIKYKNNDDTVFQLVDSNQIKNFEAIHWILRDRPNLQVYKGINLAFTRKNGESGNNAVAIFRDPDSDSNRFNIQDFDFDAIVENPVEIYKYNSIYWDEEEDSAYYFAKEHETCENIKLGEFNPHMNISDLKEVISIMYKSWDEDDEESREDAHMYSEGFHLFPDAFCGDSVDSDIDMSRVDNGFALGLNVFEENEDEDTFLLATPTGIFYLHYGIDYAMSVDHMLNDEGSSYYISDHECIELRLYDEDYDEDSELLIRVLISYIDGKGIVFKKIASEKEAYDYMQELLR